MFRKKFIILVLLAFVVINTVFSNDIVIESIEYDKRDRVRSFSFQINTLPFISSLIYFIAFEFPDEYYFGIDFEFQYAINDYINIFINPLLTFNRRSQHLYRVENQTRIYGSIIYTINSEYEIITGLLYRPFEERLKGLYIGAYFPIGFSTIKKEEHNFSNGNVEISTGVNDIYTILGIGVSSGYQWVFKNGFTISLGAGLQKRWFIGSQSFSPNILEFRLPIRFGYSF